MPKNSIRIEPFDPSSHSREMFDCGVTRLDNFIKLSARKQQKDSVTQTHVAVFEGQSDILGYYSVNMGEVDAEGLPNPPKNLPPGRNLPVIFIGQIAVDRKMQGQGIGGLLILDAYRLALDMAAHVGCHAIVLDVISDGRPEDFGRRKALYESYHFQQFSDDLNRMFISMKGVRSAMEKAVAASK